MIPDDIKVKSPDVETTQKILAALKKEGRLGRYTMDFLLTKKHPLFLYIYKRGEVTWHAGYYRTGFKVHKNREVSPFSLFEVNIDSDGNIY